MKWLIDVCACVSPAERQRLLEQVLTRHGSELAEHAIITVSAGRIRVRNP